MSEAEYNFSKIANITLNMQQGVTFKRRWRFYFKDETSTPFPIFDDLGEPLWKGRCMFRASYDAALPLLSLDSDGGGVSLDYIDNPDGTRDVFYGLYVSADDSATVPAAKTHVYDIELERLSDGWVIRPQKGKLIVDPEATK